MKPVTKLALCVALSSIVVFAAPPSRADDDQDNAQGIQNAIRQTGDSTPVRNEVNRNMDEGDKANGRDSRSPPPPQGKDAPAK
ncbi:hypothetical protein P3T40_007461 [Paraburkholderia sp. EB58]|uniref:hypothetical protein n=1 Tax=Paraburkholderia sp. EB58 TaxID=3035125 RepID=UPI003D2141F6